MDFIKEVDSKYLKDPKKIPAYQIGDTLSISKVIAGEGKGKRTQVFTGLLIALASNRRHSRGRRQIHHRRGHVPDPLYRRRRRNHP